MFASKPSRPSARASGRLTAVLGLGILACTRGERRVAPSSVATPPSSSATALPAPPPAHGQPCGAWDCLQFDSPAEAFAVATAGAPLVIGIGEAHSLRDSKVPSAARRFTEELLPLLAGRASDLLLELMQPPAGCDDAAVEVQTRQEPVTSRQAANSQRDYVALGERARSAGIVPDLLRPSCADLDAIRRAGDDAITVSLETIARLSVAQTERLVDRARRSRVDRGKAVVLYGGALHNDLMPDPEHERWSYAPALDAYVGARFVAIDLIVPELIGDDDAWRAMAWRSSYDRDRLGGKCTLFRMGARSYVLVWPRTGPAAP